MIVWTNGCFDVLHVGHIELFEYARSLGDYLVVGVDEDERVKSSKGENRPFNRLEDRMAMLESIRYIDEVVSFNSDEELKSQILKCEASIIVVGSDYVDKKVIGSDIAKVIHFDKIPNYSTTRILKGLQ